MPEHTSFLSYFVHSLPPAVDHNVAGLKTFIAHDPVNRYGLEPLIWSVLAGLRAIGEDVSSPYIRRAVSWLESKQNPDGGWGGACLSYAEEAHSGKGQSTPSQTAWALMALMSAGVHVAPQKSLGPP